MKSDSHRIRNNIDVAQKAWGELPTTLLEGLKELTVRHGMSVAAGDIQQIEGRWYVTHAGLLRTAQRRRCHGIRTSLQKTVSDPIASRWVFKATVYKTANSRGFVGYGDAEPSNVSSLVRGSEMRIAETRAVNRALRKAYGIGLCSVEELGSFSAPQKPVAATTHSNGHHGSNGSSNGQPRLRDQLCLLIRQHNLDPTLVKAYAADFCGTQTLADATRDLVESFISHLSSSAKEDLDGLICKLNSYSHPAEVKQ